MTVEVQEVLHSFPTSDPMPDRVTFVTSVISGGEEGVDEGGPRLAVGHEYVAGFGFSPSDGWHPYARQATFRVDDGRIEACRGTGTIHDEVDGLTVEELRAALADTPVIPGVDTSVASGASERQADVDGAGG